MQATFGITTWPTTAGTYELGGRTLDVLGIPGHEAQHIAIYDRQTGLLLTGDTLYPGLLFINDWATYRMTINRLAQFVGAHPISYVLGAHIEMTSTPKQVYPYGRSNSPACERSPRRGFAIPRGTDPRSRSSETFRESFTGDLDKRSGEVGRRRSP